MKDIPIKYIQERIELLQESKAYEDNLWGGKKRYSIPSYMPIPELKQCKNY